MSIPTPQEVGAAIGVAGQFSALFAVCAFAGLRLGEACALKVSDVNFLRKEIQVQRQVQFTDDKAVEIRPPKYSSERTVAIPEGLAVMLAEHVRLHSPGDDPDRWLSPGHRNPELPAHISTVGKAWRAARRKVGITHRLHDLRHFYASGLIAAGCDPVTVQRALAHASAAMTLRVYSHLWPDADGRTRHAASELFDGALGCAADALRTEH